MRLRADTIPKLLRISANEKFGAHCHARISESRRMPLLRHREQFFAGVRNSGGEAYHRVVHATPCPSCLGVPAAVSLYFGKRSMWCKALLSGPVRINSPKMRACDTNRSGTTAVTR